MRGARYVCLIPWTLESGSAHLEWQACTAVSCRPRKFYLHSSSGEAAVLPSLSNLHYHHYPKSWPLGNPVLGCLIPHWCQIAENSAKKLKYSGRKKLFTARNWSELLQK